MNCCFIIICISLLLVSMQSGAMEQSDAMSEHEVSMSHQDVDLPEMQNIVKAKEKENQEAISEIPSSDQTVIHDIAQEPIVQHDNQLPDHESTNQPTMHNAQDEHTTTMITPPAMPETLSESEPEEVHLEEMHIPDTQISSIDTMALENPQGNWLIKKMWWERAEERYEKLKNLTDDISDKRVDFFKQRASHDKDLFDTLYLQLGMGFSEFSTTIDDLIDRLSKEDVVESDLKEKKQSLIDTMKLEKSTIEQVKVHIDDLKKIDSAIEDALGIVIETVNKARQYERDGWNYFKEISRLLDDKKARELFYKIDVVLQNMKQLNNYLTQAFASYFSTLEMRARATAATLHGQLSELKEKGIDLRKKVADFEQEEKKEEPVEIAPIEEEEEEEQKKPTSWWRRTVDTIKSLFGF